MTILPLPKVPLLTTPLAWRRQKLADEQKGNERCREAAMKVDKEAIESQTLVQDYMAGEETLRYLPSRNGEKICFFLFRGTNNQADLSVFRLVETLPLAGTPVREEFLTLLEGPNMQASRTSCPKMERETNWCR